MPDPSLSLARSRLRGHLATYVVTNLVFVAIWLSNRGDPEDAQFFWPMFPIAFWGLGIVRQWQRMRDSVPELAPAAILPASAARGVQALGEALRAHGRGSLADALDAGAKQVEELLAFRAALGDVERQESEAGEEAERLRVQSRDAIDEEARATWTAGAETAARRVQKLAALRVEYERASARIEAFRQTVKSLEADVARLATRGTDDRALSALDDQARSIEGEVDALAKTREELRRIETSNVR